MDEFFNKNSLAMRFLTNVCNLILVNFIFIIFSLPIFTIGASMSSMYRIVFMMLNDEEIFIFRDFKKEFKSSFKNATIVWVPILLLSVFFGIELYYLNDFKNIPWVQIPIWIMIFFIVSLIFYAFPLMAAFENSLKNTVKNAITLSIANLPTTIFFAVLYIVMLLLIDYNPVFIVIFFSFALFIGCSVMALIQAVFLRRIFGLDKLKKKNSTDTDKM